MLFAVEMHNPNGFVVMCCLIVLCHRTHLYIAEAVWHQPPQPGRACISTCRHAGTLTAAGQLPAACRPVSPVSPGSRPTSQPVSPPASSSATNNSTTRAGAKPQDPGSQAARQAASQPRIVTQATYPEHKSQPKKTARNSRGKFQIISLPT